MIRRPETVAFWSGRLPHWEVVDGRYFVTIHLTGAIPESGQNRIRALSAQYEKIAPGSANERIRLHRRVFAEMEAWLDRAEQVAHLRTPAVAEVVMEAIASRQGRDWNVFEFVVMPSHIHLFFELLRPGLKRCLEQFKRWTGHEAVKVLGTDADRFWQDEWFDHWSRSDEQDERIIRYIRRNPERAGLVANYLQWRYGGWTSRPQ